jgi:poly(A) polymerase
LELLTRHTIRELVLGRVAGLVKKFVRLSRGLSEAAANVAGGDIFTFGPYRLGVHGPGSDIDTLCVVPKHVSRDNFFDVFEPMLRDFEGVTEVSICLEIRIHFDALSS